MSTAIGPDTSHRAHALGMLVAAAFGLWAGSAAATCENNLYVRGPGFEFDWIDTEPYADKPIGTDAASDSAFDASVAQLYDRLAKGLAIASHIHRRLQTDIQPATGEALHLQQARGLDLRRRTSDSGSPAPPPDPIVERLRQGATDSVAVLYTVQIGSFVREQNAQARVERLTSLIVEHNEEWDSTQTVEWQNVSCGDGDRSADLFVLAPDEGPGSGYKVMHGLFIDRRDAVAARASVRARFALPAAVIPVRVTGRVLRAAVRPSFRRDED